MSRRRLSTLALIAQAARCIFRHAMRSALTALGITIGIAAVVWVVAIGVAGAARAEAQLEALGDRLVWVEAGSRTASGVRSGTHGATSLTLQDAQAIQDAVPLIQRLSPQVDGTAVTIFGDRNWTTRFRGVAPDYLSIKRWTIASGASFTEEDVTGGRNVCLLGQTVRDRLFGPEDPLGQVVRLNGQPFEVIGLLAPKGQSGTGQDQDDTMMVPYTTALKKLRSNQRAWLDDIVCSAAAPEAIATATVQVTDLLRQRHRIGPGMEDDFNIRHPEEVVNAQLEASRTFSNLLVSIALVSLLVGGVGVMNVMLASVAERTREIGVRLAVGATGGAVQFQFLAEAVLLTVLGGAFGAGLSVAGASVLERVLGWSIAIPPGAVVLAVLFSALVGVVFGFFPARRAAMLDPIQALRDE